MCRQPAAPAANTIACGSVVYLLAPNCCCCFCIIEGLPRPKHTQQSVRHLAGAGKSWVSCPALLVFGSLRHTSEVPLLTAPNLPSASSTPIANSCPVWQEMHETHTGLLQQQHPADSGTECSCPSFKHSTYGSCFVSSGACGQNRLRSVGLIMTDWDPHGCVLGAHAISINTQLKLLVIWRGNRQREGS